MELNTCRYFVCLLLPICLLGSGCGTTLPSSRVNQTQQYTNSSVPALSDDSAPLPAVKSAGSYNQVAGGIQPSVIAQTMENPKGKIDLAAKKSFWHTVLWYVPNRALDVVDVFRLHVRGGPGLAVNARVTNYANLYMGRYHAVFAGLPGPRLGPEIRSPVGVEQERGLLFMGVDATDDLPRDPVYSPTEFVAGAHLLLVGLELGFDPVELGDLFCGFILVDPREDDR